MSDRPPLVIVGEAPSRPNARPFDDSSSRRRLDELFGCDPNSDELARRYQLVNLWSNPNDLTFVSAIESISTLIEFARHDTVFVLCGRRVQRAFTDLVYRSYRFYMPRLDKMNFFNAFTEPNGFTYVVIPHPSGRCRWWNERSKVLEAQLYMRRFA